MVDTGSDMGRVESVSSNLLPSVIVRLQQNNDNFSYNNKILHLLLNKAMQLNAL